MLTISQYVRVARLTRPLPAEDPGCSVHRNFIKNHPLLQDIEFLPIDSVQADPCVIPLGGQRFLLWDVNHLRWQKDVMTTLMRSERRRAEIESDEIIYRRAAELLNVSGFPQRAFTASIMRTQIDGGHSRWRTDAFIAPQSVVEYILGLQERFVFFHEVAHLLIGRDQSLRRETLNRVASLIDYELKLPIERALMPGSTDLHMALTGCTEQEARKAVIDTRKAVQAAFRALKDDESGIEEVGCDLLAIDLFVDTGFDLKDRNARECLYAAILMQGQVQAGLNAVKQRCHDPEFPWQAIVDRLARVTQSRTQARMSWLMDHMSRLAPPDTRDLNAVLPFAGLFERLRTLFWSIFVPRLYTILFEELPYSVDGGEPKVRRVGVFGPLRGRENRLVLTTDSGPVDLAGIESQDLDRFVYFTLGWGQASPDDDLEMTLKLMRQ